LQAMLRQVSAQGNKALCSANIGLFSMCRSFLHVQEKGRSLQNSVCHE